MNTRGFIFRSLQYLIFFSLLLLLFTYNFVSSFIFLLSVKRLSKLFSLMSQYTFPPSSVGEVGRIGAPSRREIGHGTLAERALETILPSDDDFPYTIRVESTILESNGSSRSAFLFFLWL